MHGFYFEKSYPSLNNWNLTKFKSSSNLKNWIEIKSKSIFCKKPNLDFIDLNPNNWIVLFYFKFIFSKIKFECL